MVKEYLRPKSAEEALVLLRSRGDARLLAGGTYLLSSQFEKQGMTLVSLSGLLPQGAASRDGQIALGANTTFTDILEAQWLPAALRDAALSMGNRNIRNRATVGGNIGADKSSSSLIPFFLVSGALYTRVDMEPVASEDWSKLSVEDRGIVSEVLIPSMDGRKAAFGHFGRVGVDISVVTCAVCAQVSADRRLKDLRVAFGGMGPTCRRFTEIERLFEGQKVPQSAEIERDVAPFLKPISDVRGSEAYKRQRGAALFADLLTSLVGGSASATMEAGSCS
ncbi:MAG TPA: FAD binding domain-containing protein [Spirochaetales bacterium]|nr:FAD binding domain-containing protein [Spirochaetales bacterium]HPS14531.1 FAD binding domain-containing protein [Spirochaetales bacterium]